MQVFAEDIQKYYESRRVLKVDRLSIPEGSLTGFIGANGSGKSTLMRIMAGLEAPTRGSVRYDGDGGNMMREITMVFQKPYLLNTTVYENIAYPLKLRAKAQSQSKTHQKTAVRDRVEEVMALLDLEGFAKRKAQTLSGGEMQKVALARAIVFWPRLLLLDEPTANIDPVSIRQMEKAIRCAREKGATVVIVTHNIAQAARLCTHVAFLDSGEMAEYGETEQLIHQPQSDALRRFIQEESIHQYWYSKTKS